MKQITLKINDCLECPFCDYTDHYDGWRAEDFGQNTPKEGWYCTKMHPHKFITDSYNSTGEIEIPNWCKLKDA